MHVSQSCAGVRGAAVVGEGVYGGHHVSTATELVQAEAQSLVVGVGQQPHVDFAALNVGPKHEVSHVGLHSAEVGGANGAGGVQDEHHVRSVVTG